ncbi:hypothetical protein JCM10908_007272 [Rhodotorula pacifica]|uniref:Rax2p n=1 Tax=Rhodotorula pacifica TaxID=1495444 RepID=UPI0031758A48
MARPRSRGAPTPARHYFSPRHLAALLVCAASTTDTLAVASSLPQVDFAALGTVAVVGNFASLSLFDSENPPHPYDPQAATLLAKTTDGDVRQIGATDEGGQIHAVCQSDSNAVYIGGNFTRIGGVAVSNIAAYDPAGHGFSPLGAGLNGVVRSLACNGSTIYAGGDFAAPSGVANAGPNVAAWSTSAKAWTALPLYGFDGAVESISQSQDGRSLFFGGEFTTSFANGTVSNGTPATSSSGSPSSSSPSFPSLGSSLTPISLNSSDYWASPTTWTSGYGRPQYVFCPRREDGIGASWLLVDGQAGFFIVRMYRELNVRGIRLGNTFVEGRGTQNFSVVSIPNDQVLTLTYATDPTDPSSPLATCSDNCPLAHDPSVPYQDFLFPEGTTLAGFQLNIFGWYGAGGGLHLLQLLSEGSVAYAVEAQNAAPCTAGLGAMPQSSVSTQGTWQQAQVNTAIAGTVQEVLVAEVTGGATPSTPPSVTWTPAVSQDGNYAVYFITPGCTAAGTCPQRTLVEVTATPNGGSANQTIVDQRNEQDQATLIYNGTLSAVQNSLTVTMTLAAGGAPTAGKTYQLVADYINLVAASTNGTTTRIERGYGLYEYPLVDTGTFGDAVATSQAQGVNASATMTNATGLDALAFRLAQGSVVNSIVTAGQGTDSQVFVGGNFTYRDGGAASTAVNVLGYRAKQALLPPNGGLNGPVTSLALMNGALFAAGTFTATADGSVSNLAGIAKWNFTASANSWESLANVPSFGGHIEQVAVAQHADGSSALVVAGAGGSGLAFFESSTSSWNSSAAGFFLGNLTAVSASSSASASANATTYLAGNVLAAAESAMPGGAVLSSSKQHQPQLSSFSFGFDTSGAAPVASSSSSTRAVKRSGNLALDRRSFSRVTLEPRAPAPSPAVNLTLPSPIQAFAATNSNSDDQVLAGAFWKNGSNGLMLVGGAFVSSNGVANLGAYDSESGTLSSLPGLSINGTVTTLRTVSDSLWIGGNFSSSGNRISLTAYDLKSQQVDGSAPPLTGYAETNATVNVITQRPGSDNEVLVAGAFASAGPLYCASICLWDTKALQWSSLGAGLPGAVGAIDFAGANSAYLVAAGSFVIGGETRYIARWNFQNQTWLNVGAANDLPGPATAVSADDHDEDKIFVAGASASGVPYLLYWNGTVWQDVNNSTLGAGSGVQQLVFVPLAQDHDSNGVLESNRMLLVSGDLQINDTSVSSALFDGVSWYPFLVATAATGSAGAISQLFYSITNFSLSAAGHLAAGLVILISIAIGLGVVFLLVLIGLLIALARRKEEQQYPPRDPAHQYDSAGYERSQRPSSLLQTVGAATAVMLDGKGEKSYSPDQQDPDSSFGDDSAVGYGSEFGEEREASTALARYSFHAEHPGELSISANEQLSILESGDPNWWMVANSQGQRGLVPLSYLA